MATIKLCDWLKERLDKGEVTYTILIDDKEFEVGEAGKKALLDQLEGEDPPGKPEIQVVEKVVEREPAPPPLQAAAPDGLQVEIKGDPFSPGPTSMPEPVQAQQEPTPTSESTSTNQDVDPAMMLEIPDNPRKKFRTPSTALSQRIIEEAKKFEEGSLPALTMGAKQQREAMQKLRELEEKEEGKLRRKAPGGVNLGGDVRNRPGYYD